jgi:hypothetical protein
VGWSLQEADVVDCVFTGRMTGGRSGGSFWGAPLEQDIATAGKSANEFRGNDFTGCRLANMDFRRGVDLRLQRLPAGPNYLCVEDGAGALAALEEAASSWPEEQRRLAAVHARVLARTVADGQDQLFVSNETGWLDTIWPLLRQVWAALMTRAGRHPRAQLRRRAVGTAAGI